MGWQLLVWFNVGFTGVVPTWGGRVAQLVFNKTLSKTKTKSIGLNIP